MLQVIKYKQELKPQKWHGICLNLGNLVVNVRVYKKKTELKLT